MDKRGITTLIVAFALTVATAPGWAGNGGGFGGNPRNGAGAMSAARGSGGMSGGCGLAEYLSSIPAQEVDDAETAMLVKMRQEEKLARDVYLALYERWGLAIFNNIANSEQFHMNAIKVLLDRYGIEDPASNDERGVFQDAAFSELYQELVAKGETSIMDALLVGATIEDLDIKDLEDEMALTDNLDIETVFQNLAKGSRNHLRSFYRLISANGLSYTPQYISQSEFDEIVNSPAERGVVYDAEGNPVTYCGATQ